MIRMSEPSHKVLIASDDTFWTKSALITLSEHGIIAEIAQDGAEAEKKLLEDSYEVAVLDLYMRMKSAAEVLKTVKRSGISTPILVFSLSNNENDRIEMLGGGAAGFFVKPSIDLDSLPNLLTRYIV